MIKKWIPSEPVIHIDDSDVVKPDGNKFEALGIARDGSESTSTKNVYKKGYHVTEACALTTSSHLVSIFPRWKIEEYFRCKKQMFQFENCSVRGSGRVYSGASTLQAALLDFFENRQIGTSERYIHFLTTFCGNSRRLHFDNFKKIC